MGMRGPAKTPTSLQIIRGNPGKRPVNKDDAARKSLSAAEVEAKCPEHLNEQGQRWWKYYAGMFCPVRLLTETDLPMLEILARATADRIDYEGQLDKAGPLYKSPKTGHVGISPVYGLANSARDREYRMLREFGGSPTTRANVPAANGPQSNDEWANL